MGSSNKKQYASVQVDPRVLARVREYAKQSGMKMTAIADRAFEEYLRTRTARRP